MDAIFTAPQPFCHSFIHSFTMDDKFRGQHLTWQLVHQSWNVSSERFYRRTTDGRGTSSVWPQAGDQPTN